jgi:tetratricopeptide (TPR) repeat protein
VQLFAGLCSFGSRAEAQDAAQAQAELSRAMAAQDLPAMARALDTIIAQNQALGGLESPATLVPLETRATVAQMMGDMKLSEQLYREALAGRVRIGAPEDEQIALDANNLAQAIEAQGRYADAEPFYRKALEIREKTAAPYARELALSVNNLANNLSSSVSLGSAARAAGVHEASSIWVILSACTLPRQTAAPTASPACRAPSSTPVPARCSPATGA